MKKNGNVIKVFIIGLFLLFFITIVLFFSFVKMLLPIKEQEDKREIISKHYTLNEITELEFDFKKANVIFEIGDNDDLLIVQNTEEERFYLNNERNGSKLYFEEDGYIINSQKKYYNIYLPRSYLDKINIINGFGQIKIIGIHNYININNNSGNIELNDIGDLNLKDVSGNVSIKKIDGNVIATSSTGNLYIEEINGSINAESITGNIRILDFIPNSNSSIENVSGNIILNMNGNAICKINYKNETGKTKINNNVCNKEVNIISIKNVTGMININ